MTNCLLIATEGGPFLLVKKESSVCFVDVRRIATGASEFKYNIDLLNGCVLSLVLAKKHNLVVFCFIRFGCSHSLTFESTRHPRSLCLSFLTSIVVRSPANIPSLSI